MCDFKPGDEVVCVDNRPVIDVRFAPITPLVKGCVYLVKKVYYREVTDSINIILDGHPNISYKEGDVGFRSERFRKVQRRNISQWLETATDYEEPKRKKANA